MLSCRKCWQPKQVPLHAHIIEGLGPSAESLLLLEPASLVMLTFLWGRVIAFSLHWQFYESIFFVMKQMDLTGVHPNKNIKISTINKQIEGRKRQFWKK